MSTANPATANTDGVKSTDRTAGGPQPDMTPVAPGGSPSSSGVTQIVAGGGIAVSPVTGTGVVTVSATGGGTGTVTSVATAGRGLSTSPNPIVATGTITGFDPNTYNICDYGAVPGANSTAAIAAAIAAGIASALPFTIYVPEGTYESTTKQSGTLGTGQGMTIKGDGMGVSQIYFSNTGTNNGFAFARTASGGTYLTDHAVTFCDLSLVCNSSSSSSIAISLSSSGVDAGTQGSRINRVGFISSNNTTAYWGTCILLDTWVQTWIEQCYGGGITQFVRITGSNSATSIFWITDCQIQGGTYGVKVDGTGGATHRIEGVFCRGNSFIQQDYAVWMENSNTGGALEVSGGQINTKANGAGVHVKGVVGITVSGISSFVNVSGSTTTWNAVEILDACWGANIFGNTFAGNAAGGVIKGVYISGGSGVAPVGSVNAVHGNSFEGFNSGAAGSKNVEFAAAVSRSNCSNNVSDAGAYTDSGTADNFNNNI